MCGAGHALTRPRPPEAGLDDLSQRERRDRYPLSLWERAGVRAFLVAGRNNSGATLVVAPSYQRPPVYSMIDGGFRGFAPQ